MIEKIKHIQLSRPVRQQEVSPVVRSVEGSEEPGLPKLGGEYERQEMGEEKK